MSPRPLSSSSPPIPHNPYVVPADVPRRRENWPTMYDLPSEDPEEPGSGRWILTPMKMAQQRAERLAELLRSQGIDPDQI